MFNSKLKILLVVIISGVIAASVFITIPSPRLVFAASDDNCVTDDLCKGEFCRINGICTVRPGGPDGKCSGLICAKSVFDAIKIALQWLLTLAGVIAVVFIIIGGYQYITSGGNEEAAEKGRKTLVNAVIGLVVVILAMTIVTILANTLGSDKVVLYLKESLKV